VVNNAHAAIGDLVAADSDKRGMGTTLSALVACDEQVVLGHIGDSRIYRLRGDEFRQITSDHTYVQMLVDNGEISAQEALTHPRRNLLMRAIDGIHDVMIDITTTDLQVGDKFILCSDGLSGVVSNERIKEVLESEDLTYVVMTLIDFALSAGAPDNVTVIAAEYRAEVVESIPFLVGAAVNESATTSPVAGELETASPAWKRWWPLGVGVLAVLGITAIFNSWLSSQWFVGTDGQSVVIYQGVPQQLGPFDLSTEIEVTDLAFSVLTEVDQESLRDGVTVSRKVDAESVVIQLGSRSTICSELPQGCS
jgi:protein phosphatase